MLFDDDTYHTATWEHNYLVDTKLDGEDSPNVGKAQEKVRSLLEMTGRAPSETDVLDVGCGNGRNGVFLTELGYSCTCADASEEAIRRARQRCDEADAQIRLLYGSSLTLDQLVPAASFDVVLDAYCFHVFVIDRQRAQHLENLHRVLRPGGWVVLLAAHEADASQEPVGSFEEFCQKWDTKPEGIPAGRFVDGEWETVEEERIYLLARPQSLEGYCKEFEEAGFEVVFKEQFGEPSKAAFVLRKAC